MRLSGWALVLLVFLSAYPQQPGAQEIPPVLAPWRAWAMRGEEHRTCPMFLGGQYGEPAQHPCAWPGRLRLDVGENGAAFEMLWTVFRDSLVPLAGSETLWPREVRLDGAEAVVLERDGIPHVQLSPGQHRVEGTLRWERQPEALPVPPSVAWVELWVQGQRVLPGRREKGALWLGGEKPESFPSKALALQVYRLLQDGIPGMLETRLRLEVSGEAREEALGPVLPRGFVPTSLEGPLPMSLGTDNILRVQARPGTWEITVRARALQPLSTVEIPAAPARWAGEEVWSYQAQPGFRPTTVRGGLSVDPGQAEVPGAWRGFPAVVVTPGQTLRVEEHDRGLGRSDATRLELVRRLWVDMEGSGVSFHDRISGRMERGFRLDLAEPLLLQRAQERGQPLLVTAGQTPGLRGVELRNPQVELAAYGRLERLSWWLPVSGWQAPLASVTWELTLPPGRVLLAAFGAEESPDAWLSRWNALDGLGLFVGTFLAFRLMGLPGALLAFVFLSLSRQTSPALFWALLALFFAALLRRMPAPPKLARLANGFLWVSFLVFGVVAVPSAYLQLALALYPQLESGAWGGVALLWESLATSRRPQGTASSPPPSAPKAFVVQAPAFRPPSSEPAGEARKAPEALLEQAELAGRAEEVEQLRKMPPVQGEAPGKEAPGKEDEARLMRRRFIAANVFQAGEGEPAWHWRTAILTWRNPVPPEKKVLLVVTPLWLARLWRVASVGLLIAILLRLRQAFGSLTPPWSSTPSPWAAAGALLLWCAGAWAQATPDPELLAQLRERLTAPPPCDPHCASLPQAKIAAAEERLELLLTFHAGASVAVPLPSAEGSWAVSAITVDGAPPLGLLSRNGTWWVPLSPGIHHVKMLGLPTGNTVDLRFPLQPKSVLVQASGWEVAGLFEGRLRTDTLTLVKTPGATRTTTLERAQARIAPFVLVTRELALDLTWRVTTKVERIAPPNSSLTVEVPLLPGEAVLTPGFTPREGRVMAVLGPEVREVFWRSRLEHRSPLVLTAPSWESWAERWRVLVSPQWHAAFRGVLPSAPAAPSEVWVQQFDPLPGESLEIHVSRPHPVAGPTVAVDRCRLRSVFGESASEHLLELAIRATTATLYTVTLPAEAAVEAVKLRGEALPLRPQQGKITVPVDPGSAAFEVRWRDHRGAGLLASLPHVALASTAANVELAMELPASRVVVSTKGPLLGPAVLYWGGLAMLLLAAWGLSRIGWVPLTFRQWLLLGFGLSLLSWVAAVVVAFCLLALEARRRLEGQLPSWRFNFVQLGLGVLSVVALVCLLLAVRAGLAGMPNLGIAGYGSTAQELRWFADRTAGPLPPAGAVTLPLWLFRLGMAGWTVWLAATLPRLVRWAWSCFTAGGIWRREEEPELF